MSEEPETLKDPSHPGAVTPATPQADTGQALLSLVDDVFGDTPDTEWDKLPSDLSAQHDHYLYGADRKSR